MERVAWGLAACVLLLAGCGGGKGASAPAVPAGPVQLNVKEWAVEIGSPAVKAGKVTLQVKNAGSLEHDFVVEGVGKIPLLLPGETRTLELELKPGSYTVLCSLPGHKEAGMQTKLTVSR